MNAQQLISGYEAYTSAADLSAAPGSEAPGATPTTVTISSAPCIAASIGGVSVIISVSIDNTFDHGC